MTINPLPQIPPPQCGDEPGTWAHKTISSRFPKTVQRILVENNFPEAIQARLRELIAEIPHALIRPIDDPRAPDLHAWHEYVNLYRDRNWYQPPWFFTEHYFYRRIIEATRYFQSGDGGSVDPFNYQKRMGLEVSQESINELMTHITCMLENKAPDPTSIVKLLYLDLWGNQADLSLWPAEGGDKPDHEDLEKARSNILVDQTGIVATDIIKKKPYSRIDFLVDNAGFELVSDLAFSDYLLTSGITSSIRLHVKIHPTYVSDAMEKDVRATIEFLRADQEIHTKASGERLRDALRAGNLQIKGTWFWTSPLDGWRMSEKLKEELSQAGLVISKGDANYRRLLGDRHWPYTTRFNEVVSYYPSDILALRTLKSELVVGLRNGQEESVAVKDPDWMLNGRWGMVQYHPVDDRID
jgi:uncharacterized protein with ATP-grasp and redox domains